MPRPRLAVLCVAGLLLLTAPAAGGEALDRLERVLMIAQALDCGMPPETDLTDEINGLLLLPKEQVCNALEEALDHGRRRESIAHTFVPLVADLARFLTDTPRGPRDRGEPFIFVEKGVLTLRADPDRQSFRVHEVPKLSQIIPQTATLRARLKTVKSAEPKKVDAEPEFRRILAEAADPPHVEDYRRLAAAVRIPIHTFDEFSDCWWLAAIDEEDSSEAIVAASQELVRALVWPRWSGRSETAIAYDGETPMVITVTALGGHPATANALRTSINVSYEQGLRWAPRPFAPLASHPLAPQREYVLADLPPSGVEVTARLLPTTVRVVIRNTGKDPLLVNKEAFTFAAVRSLEIQDGPMRGPGSRTELRLTAGTLGRGMQPLVANDRMFILTLAPGAARTFTLPLPGPVWKGTRVFVEFYDPTELDEPPTGARRLRSFRGVEAVDANPPLTGNDLSARILLDRIVLYDENGEDDLDLTAAANELLSLGRLSVERAFRDALDRGCRKGTTAAEWWERVLSLATALMDVPTHKTGTPWEVEAGFRNLAGFVVAVSQDSMIYAGPAGPGPYPPGLPDLGGGFPDRLKPDPEALLTRCLKPDKHVRLGSDEFRRTAGAALGFAAGRNPALAKKLLAEFSRRPFDEPDERDSIGVVLGYAAGRLGGSKTRLVLGEKIASLLAKRRKQGVWMNLRALTAALRTAGGERDLLRMAEPLGPLLGSDLQLRSLLLAKPGPSTLTALTEAAREPYPPVASPETLLRVLDLGLRDESMDLIQAILWPYNQYPVRSSYSSAWSPKFGGPPAKTIAVSETGQGVGGWPDPIAGARWLRDQIRSGVIRVVPHPAIKLSLFSVVQDAGIGGRPVSKSVTFAATRDGDLLRISVTNRAGRKICVNPLAFRLATSEVVTRTETRDDVVTKRRSVSLFLGWGFYWHASVISPDQLLVLWPLDKKEFTFPLKKGLPPDTKITVRFEDPFTIAGKLPHPRLLTVETVDVK